VIRMPREIERDRDQEQDPSRRHSLTQELNTATQHWEKMRLIGALGVDTLPARSYTVHNS
jgi:hypothetical protein